MSPIQGSNASTGKDISDQSSWPSYLKGCAAGDQAAFALLYDATRRLVYSIALRILGEPADAEEVTMDVYMQVWRSAKEYTELRGSVSAWLVLLTRSRSIDRLRSRASRSKREEPFEEFSQFRSSGPGPDRETEESQLELAFFSGLTHSELATHLEQPLGTVKSRVRQGMMKIRELLVELK
jgi:RNA polymerase sigma-70 factor (ECF subfamily)